MIVSLLGPILDKVLVDLWKNFWSLVGPILFFVFLFYIKYPEKFEKILIHIDWLLSRVSREYEKRAITKEVRYIVYTKFKENFEVEEIPEIVIEWGDEEKAIHDIKRGRLVVVLKAGKNRYESLAKTLIVSIPELLSPEIRAVLDENFVECLSAHVAKNIVRDYPSAVTTVNRVIMSRIGKNEDLKRLASMLVVIDDQSLLSRILIPEIVRVARKRYPQKDPRLDREVWELVRMLYKIAQGEDVEGPPLVYGNYVKVLFLRVAKPEKIDALLEPHIAFVKKMLAKYDDLETIYVLAAGKRNCAAAWLCVKWLKDMLEFQGRRVRIKNYKYKGKYWKIHGKIELYVGRIDLT
ncbi:MAG: hypothetical protein ACTSXC_07450 [Candidatus Freyarchaeota archaeon]